MSELHVQYHKSILARVYDHSGYKLPHSRVSFGSEFLSETCYSLWKRHTQQIEEQYRKISFVDCAKEVFEAT